jgi:glycosyltransferase involved in cell wall biosynthesis
LGEPFRFFVSSGIKCSVVSGKIDMQKVSNVSLVATVFNEEESIREFLNSLIMQTFWPEEFVVVDGGSTDKTVEVISTFFAGYESFSLKIIIDPSCNKKFSNGPIARGRNVAIANVKHGIIACTDAGCILDSKWLEEITSPFLEDPTVQAVAGGYCCEKETAFQIAFDATLVPDAKQVSSADFLPSSRSIAFKKALWEMVGGYPEDAHTGEDTAFDLKILASGVRFVPAPRAKVTWLGPRTFRESFHRHFTYGYGEGILKLQTWKFLIRWVLLLAPVHILLNQKKMKAPWIPYGLLWAHQLGAMVARLKTILGRDKSNLS